MNNTTWALTDKLFQLLSNFITVIIIARNINPSEFALYSISSMILITCFHLSSFNLKNIYISKFVSTNSNYDIKIKNSYLTIKSVLSIVFYSIFIIYFYLQKVNIFILLISVFSYILILNESDEWFFESIYKKRIIAITRILTSTTFNLIKIFIFFKFKDIMLLLMVQGLEYFSFYYILKLIRKKYYLKEIKTKVNTKTGVYYLFKRAYPLFICQFLFFVYSRIDQVMIIELSNKIELANYSVATRLTEPFVFVATAICSTALPYLTKEIKKNNENFVKTAVAYSNSLFYTSLVIIITLLLFSNIIIDLTFGNKYLDANILIKIHSFILPFSFWMTFNSIILIVINKITLNLTQSILAVISNIIFNYILIPKYGAVGASVATILTLCLSGNIIFLFMKDTRFIFNINFLHIFKFKSIKKIKL